LIRFLNHRLLKQTQLLKSKIKSSNKAKHNKIFNSNRQAMMEKQASEK